MTRCSQTRMTLAWACIGEVNIVAVAEGKIVPSGRAKVIQAPTGDLGSIGVVKSIAVEAMLQNKDIGFVEDGMEAVIKLETFPFTRYGTIPGRVVTVSSDAIERSSASSPSTDSGEGRGGGAGPAGLFYSTRIALERTTIDVDGKTVNLTPGMAATVEIKTGKRKLIEFVLSPLLKMTGEAGRER